MAGDLVSRGRGGDCVAEVGLGRTVEWSPCWTVVGVCGRGGRREGLPILCGILGARLWTPEAGHRGVESSPTPTKVRRSMLEGWGWAEPGSWAEYGADASGEVG